MKILATPVWGEKTFFWPLNIKEKCFFVKLIMKIFSGEETKGLGAKKRFLGPLNIKDKCFQMIFHLNCCSVRHYTPVRGNVQKKNSIFVDIIQIGVDPPPSYPIFDKLFFDNVLIMLTSLPPLKFLTKPRYFKL